MRNSLKLASLMALGFMTASIQQAQAFGVDFTAVGVYNRYDENADATIGYGLLIAPRSTVFGVETGVINLKRSYKFLTVREYEVMEVPFTFRLYLPFVSLGAGAYYAKSSASNIDDDYGLRGDLRFHIPMGPFLNLVLGGAYNMGLNDSNPSSSADKTKEIQGLAGLSISL